MALLSQRDFEKKYPKIGPHLFNISLWQGSYTCPCCGETHMLKESTILGDLHGYKMFVICDNLQGYLIIHVKTILGFGFKGLEVVDALKMDLNEASVC